MSITEDQFQKFIDEDLVSSSTSIEKDDVCNDHEASSSVNDMKQLGDEDSDEEISSIMEQLSQLTGDADSADRSVEELLKEAVQLARENSQNFKELGLSVDDDIELDEIEISDHNGMLMPEFMPGDIIFDGKSNRSPEDEERNELINNDVSGDAIISQVQSKEVSKKEKVVYFKDNILDISVSSPIVFGNNHLQRQQNRVPLSTSLQSVSDSSSVVFNAEIKSEPKRILKKSKTFDSNSIQEHTQGIPLFRPENNSSPSIQKDENVKVLNNHTESLPEVQYGNIKGSVTEICEIIDAEVQSEVEAVMQAKTCAENTYYNQSNVNSSLNIKDDKSVTKNHSRQFNGQEMPQRSNDMLQDILVPKIVCDQDRKYCIELYSEIIKERSISMDLRSELQSIDKDNSTKIDKLRCKYEEEIFKLRADNLTLSTKVSYYEEQLKLREQVSSELEPEESSRKHRIALLEAELHKQEQIILGSQKENERFCKKIKQLKDELKMKETEKQQYQTELMKLKMRCESNSDDNREIITKELQDKNDRIAELQLQVDTLKNENAELVKASQQFMTYKRDYAMKEDCSRVAATSKALKILNREVNRCKTELKDRDSEVITLKRELDIMKNNVEKEKNEIIALKSERQLQEDAFELRFSEMQQELEKEKTFNKKNLLQREEDKKKILDLTRQVKELEKTLKRNCPNSLILDTDSSSRIKYLESHIHQLENESAVNIRELQKKFLAMKAKYDEHVSHLELELATAKHQANMIKIAAEREQASEQESANRQSPQENKDRDHLQQHNVSKIASKKIPHISFIHAATPPLNALAVKEDAHLLATIRGLKAELVSKEKEIHKITKDLDESKKTVRKLQREREKFLHKEGLVGSKNSAVKGYMKEDKQESAIINSFSAPLDGSLKSYDPLKFELPLDNDQHVPLLKQQNETLRQDLLRLKQEYQDLKTKRLQDLSLLQEQHEMEMEQIISEHSNSRIAELHNQLSTQNLVIRHLKEQLKQLDEYKEEIFVLKTERKHFETTALDLNKKLAALRKVQTPEAKHYEALQEKLEELVYRHELREQNLQAAVRDLILRNAEHRARLKEQGKDTDSNTLREKLLQKNQQLFHFQSEFDYILNKLEQLDKSYANAVSS